jgi:hypothetical protein
VKPVVPVYSAEAKRSVLAEWEGWYWEPSACSKRRSVVGHRDRLERFITEATRTA